MTRKNIMDKIEQLKAVNPACYIRCSKLLREIEDLRFLFDADCISIERDLVEEGFPSHGTNYDIRCNYLWEEFYAPEIESIWKTIEDTVRMVLG